MVDHCIKDEKSSTCIYTTYTNKILKFVKPSFGKIFLNLEEYATCDHKQKHSSVIRPYLKLDSFFPIAANESQVKGTYSRNP